MNYLSKSLLNQPSKERFFPYACRERDGRSEEEDEWDGGLGPEDGEGVDFAGRVF
jgi:hypothetical protein